jgi:fatty acid desaturase
MAHTPPDPSTLIHLRPRNATAAAFATLAAAETGAGLWLSAAFGPAAWLTGQLLLAASLVQWFVILHEAGHGTLFRSRRANAFVGQIAGAAALIPFTVWRRVHARHHRWTGWQDRDPTTAVLTPRRLAWPERLVVNLCWRAWIPLFSTTYRLNNFWNLPRLRRLFPDARERRPLRLNILVLAGLYAAALIAIGPQMALRLGGLALFLALMVQDILIVSQHTHVPMHLSHGADVTPFPTIAQETFTRSLRLPAWASRLALHFDAHELHHMYPFVPGYRLREVPYDAEHEVDWWRWTRAARSMPGEILFFQNRDDTGFDL